MEIPQLLLCPVVQVVGAVVEKTAVLPQLHLLRNSFRAAHELRWGFLSAPAHRCRAGGRVHKDTAPIIRCILVINNNVRTTTTTRVQTRAFSPRERSHLC